MASPSPNSKDGDDGGSEFTEEAGGAAGRERPPAPQKTYVATPAAQLPSKLSFVALGAPGPSGIKQCFRTVKTARRVPTLPRRVKEGESEIPTSGERRGRRRTDRTKRHACDTCDKRFTSPGKLSQHRLAHTGELPFSCELCDKRFNSKFKLVRHSLIHSEARAFACGVCGKTFNRKDHLNNHVRVHNPVKKLHTCERPGCRKQYTSMLSFRKHTALHSAEEGNLTCKICGQTFGTRADIVYHLKLHTGSRTVKNETDKKFTCPYCDRRFFTGKDVRRHLVVHTGRRDFLCPFCPQKFGRKDHLVRHVKNAHPDEPWQTAAVGTSGETTELEVDLETEPVVPGSAEYIDFPLESVQFEGLWKVEPEESEAGRRTRVPSSDIIEEEPVDIKLEPCDVKVEKPGSPEPGDILQFPVVYLLPPPPYPRLQPDLSYLPASVLPEEPELDPHHLMADPLGVQAMLIDPGEGPSDLSSEILTLLGSEEFQDQQRVLPAFTQAFQTTQSPKPPPPPQ